MRFTFYRGAAFMVGLIAVIILALMQQNSGNHETTATGILSLGLDNYIYFIFSGAIAASAMIIPGVSGSFILILLGVYWTVLGSLSGLTSTLFVEGLTTEMVTRLAIIGSLGIGVVIGILVFSKVMSWALKNYPAITMYLILGLIIGSLYQIYPGVELSLHGAIAVITFVIGVIISLKFGVEKGAESS
jgi:putative membrane protein